MISNAFKKQLIVNAYNTQLLPSTNKINKSSIAISKNIKFLLLFKRDESFLWLDYRYKNNNIDYDIRWFLSSLIDPIYSIYNYTRNKNTDIQENISSNIKEILDYKLEIDEYKDYAKYLEDIYDK
jgi:hypothetical protein